MSNHKQDSVRETILRTDLGKALTPAALDRAVDFGTTVWRGQTGIGEAADIGVEHVVRDVLK